jgi:hypothetical protein
MLDLKKLIILSVLLMQLTPFISTANDAEWIRHGIDFTINNKFAEATTLFTNQIQVRSNDHRAYFYLAATLNSKMTHFENDEDEVLFFKMLKKTIEIAKTKLNGEKNISDSTRAQLLFYMGSAYGYKAFYEGKKGSWYSAVSNGIRSVKLLKKAVALDSTLYDAYLGIGTYKYWRYSRLKFISWFPLVPDDREEGIKLIKKSIESSKYSRYLAMQQLIYILLDFKKPKEAIPYAQTVIQKYPESQFMWWAAAHTYLKNRDYLQAASAYSKLGQLIENDKTINPAHIVEYKVKLAFVYKELGKLNLCLDQCREILGMGQKDKKLSERLNSQFKRAQELYDFCMEKLEFGAR